MGVQAPIGQEATIRGPERPRRRALGCLLTGLVVLGAGTVAAVVCAAVAISTFRGLADLDVAPGDGTDSLRLAVAVAPTEGLTDGATVLVTSEAFGAHHVVSIGQCLATAEEEGVAACDTDGGQRYAVGADGKLAATVPIRRVITVDGEAHDCAATPGRCLLVAADASDYDRSGGMPLRFADGLPPADLTPRTGARPTTLRLPGTLAPEGPVATGTELTATVGGLVPGEPVIAGLCGEAFLDEGITACEPATDDAVAALLGRSVEGVELHADETGTATFTVAAPAEIDPLADDPVDCTAAPGHCALVVGAAADPQRSAYLPFTVSP